MMLLAFPTQLAQEQAPNATILFNVVACLRSDVR